MNFSILISNYNNAKYLAQSIESVLLQTKKEWELLIIDDFSQDNSVEVIKKYLSDDRIKLTLNEKNIGKTQSLKKIVKRASGEIVVILDSDDVISSDALEKLAKYYVNNPQCDYVYSQCYYCDDNLNPVHLGFSKSIPSGKTNLHDNSVVALRSFKKSVYSKTSGYDENIRFAEDIDLTLKIEEVGKLCFLNEPLYYYRVLDKSQTHGFRNTQINRSSTALAKFNAYERRLKTSIPNLNKNEIAEVLFWGIITSVVARRPQLTLEFIFNICKINPFFFLHPFFHRLVFKKVLKMLKLKKEKPLLRI